MKVLGIHKPVIAMLHLPPSPGVAGFPGMMAALELLRVDKNVPLVGTILACSGVGLTLWALWSLGPSFGIAPADRGLVTYGPYRYLRHPMYAGALLNMLPAVLWNPTPWNLGVAALILGISLLRIHLEERTVTAYSQYADRVRWRLIPFVW